MMVNSLLTDDDIDNGNVSSSFSDDDDINKKIYIVSSNPNALKNLIGYLQKDKLIYDVREYLKPIETSYFDCCNKSQSILKSNQNNKIYLCHMIETKEYKLEEIKEPIKESAIDLDAFGGMDISGLDGDSSGESWLEFEPENVGDADDDDDDDFDVTDDDDDDDMLVPIGNNNNKSSSNLHSSRSSRSLNPLKKKKGFQQYKIVIKSTFKCLIAYEFYMSSIYANILNVEDIMIMQTAKHLWTNEDHKLLTRFQKNNIFNQYDLLDKQLIKKLKSKLTKGKIDVATQRFDDKFTKFIDSVKPLLRLNNIHDPLKQFVIPGVEVTRNAKLLQQYIHQFNSFNNNNDSTRTMIIGYNPIQTVVVTNNIIRDVTHPIHVYHAAYDSKLYPRNQLSSLYTEWMELKQKKGNIIGALSTLSRYNKKYEIILVPSSIHLDFNNFLSNQCELVPPDHEAIADYRITFLYKGLLYRYDKKKAKKLRSLSLQTSIDLDFDDDDKIFVDEIKFLLRLLHDNISENQLDALDPDEDVFDINIINPPVSNNPIDMISSVSNNNSNSSSRNNNRLRGSIKRKHTDRIYRWLSLGCGSCFLHEISGRAKQIGPEKQEDHEKEFPSCLQKSIFEYYIDCRVPFSDDIISDNNKCAICYDLMINPSNIGNPACNHIFCKLCIEHWYDNNIQNNNNNAFNQYNNNDNMHSKKHCPCCRSQIIKINVIKDKIKVMKNGIPKTIYQQIMEENQSRYTRMFLQDKYHNDRENQLLAEQLERPLADLYNDNPQLQDIDAGY